MISAKDHGPLEAQGYTQQVEKSRDDDNTGKMVVNILLDDMATHRNVETRCVPFEVECTTTGGHAGRASRIRCFAYLLRFVLRFEVPSEA